MRGDPPNPPTLATYPGSMFAIWIRDQADTVTRQRRSTAIGIGLSLLLHVLLLTATLQYKPNPAEPLASSRQEPITVRLAPRPSPTPAPAVEPEPAPAAKPRPERPRSKVIAVPKSARKPTHTVPAEPEPVPPQQAQPEQEQPIDMTAMINAARARRQQAEAAAAQENAAAAAAERAPSPNDIALANIQRSLQGKRDGTGGVFQVVRKGVRTGTFIFRGWTPGARGATQQTIEVDAGPNGDVELAIVRRMIALIRTHYTGDFNWESHRLGRVVVKSARPEDSAELEAFLMMEFFGSPTAH